MVGKTDVLGSEPDEDDFIGQAVERANGKIDKNLTKGAEVRHRPVF